MKRAGFTKEQIIGILEEHEAELALPTCRATTTMSASLCEWKARDGGMEVSDARELGALGDENTKLKRLLADAMPDNSAP